MDYRPIGKNIKQKRKEKGWKQYEFAERMDLSVSYIGMIERGEKLPRMETFLEMINLLEVSADEMLAGVIDKGYQIRISKYTDRIGKLSPVEQEKIYEILDVLLKK